MKYEKLSRCSFTIIFTTAELSIVMLSYFDSQRHSHNACFFVLFFGAFFFLCSFLERLCLIAVFLAKMHLHLNRKIMFDPPCVCLYVCVCALVSVCERERGAVNF